jgi:RNA polymerase sigma-70 factor, ECF subfamily
MMVATERGTNETPAAFEDFFRAEYPRLVRMLGALCGDLQRGEDLAQDALAAAHARWARISRYDSPGTWVRRVALNRSANVHRRRLRESAALNQLPHDDSEGVVELADGELWRAVRALPEQQRWAVALFYIADAPIAEIAAVLGCSEGTVKTHLSRARHTLARALQPTASEPR